jgi:Arc/MetJ family transcription regulator
MHRTNVELDEKLVKEGMRLFNKRTKKELIHFALSELIRREKAKGILDLEGKVQWKGDLKSSTPAPPLTLMALVPIRFSSILCTVPSCGLIA